MASAVGHWPALLPQTISNQGQSLKFVTKLFQIGVSSVAYLRFNIPEEAFKQHDLDGIKVMILTGDKGCRSAKALINAVSAAMEALKRGYLSEFMLYVYENDPDEVYEMFKFSFPKPRESSAGRKIDPAKLIEATKSMMKKLISSTQELDNLPQVARMGVRISLHEDVAPKDFSLPTFIDCSPDQSSKFWATSCKNSSQTKMMSTNWHSYQCFVISDTVKTYTFSQSQHSALGDDRD